MGRQSNLDKGARQDLLDAFRIISSVFWGVDMDKCRRLYEGTDLLPLENLAPLMTPKAGDVCRALKNFVQAFPTCQALHERLAEDYIPLFVSTRGRIVAPLYQSCYPGEDMPPDSAILMGPAAERMQARFRDRGLDLDTGMNEPPDHLAIELEYLYFLLQKGWQEQDAALIAEASDFAGAEMLSWVPEIEKRLQAAAAGSFYALVTTLLVGLLHLIAEQ